MLLKPQCPHCKYGCGYKVQENSPKMIWQTGTASISYLRRVHLALSHRFEKRCPLKADFLSLFDPRKAANVKRAELVSRQKSKYQVSRLMNQYLQEKGHIHPHKKQSHKKKGDSH